MDTICTTLWLFAGTAGLPAGTCALMCELKGAVIAVESYDTGKAMLIDGQWFTAHRVDGRWFMALESDPEQCWRGGTSQLESAR